MRLNKYSMTADEKLILARFLDLASGAVRDGYRGAEREYRFDDDGSTGGDGFAGDDNLAQIAADIRSCAACALRETRTNAVPGEGAERPLVMVIGEGPGADEDATGRPFVGRAGQLLDKMLDSIGLSRTSNCFIANTVKCRPPNNRDPLPGETAACVPFLERQARLLQPRIILCAGRIAAQTLLKTDEAVGRLRGRFTSVTVADNAVPLLVTYHPSALLRNEELKRPAWEDLKMLRAALSAGPAPAERNR
jgi:DNA polymerase